jgi:hypothetical protein
MLKTRMVSVTAGGKRGWGLLFEDHVTEDRGIEAYFCAFVALNHVPCAPCQDNCHTTTTRPTSYFVKDVGKGEVAWRCQ